MKIHLRWLATRWNTRCSFWLHQLHMRGENSSSVLCWTDRGICLHPDRIRGSTPGCTPHPEARIPPCTAGSRFVEGLYRRCSSSRTLGKGHGEEEQWDTEMAMREKTWFKLFFFFVLTNCLHIWSPGGVLNQFWHENLTQWEQNNPPCVKISVLDWSITSIWKTKTLNLERIKLQAKTCSQK